MKRIEIIFDESLERQVLMLLRQNGIEHYSKLEMVKGVGTSGSKFNDPIGPGINTLVFSYVPDEKLPALVRGFKRFKEVQGEGSGAKMAVSSVEEFI